MAKKKHSAPYNPENLPVFVHDLVDLPLWCTIIYTAFLSFLIRIVFLRDELAFTNKKLIQRDCLLRRCASFLQTTSKNSNWPSSVMSSPIMDQGRHLLVDIQSALGTTEQAENEKQNTKKPKTKDDTRSSDESSTRDKKTKPRPAHHPGVTRKVLNPDIVKDVMGAECPHCHKHNIKRGEVFSLYQVIDIVIQRIVTHFRIWECVCDDCGKRFTPELPKEAKGGNGPCITAFIGLLTALGVSRRKIQAFFKQIADLDISQGGIQKCLDKVSSAITPHYNAIAREARRVEVNYVDETSSRLFGPAGKEKHWLWAMVSKTIVFFMIQATRSKKAFEALLGDWAGILVSDGFALYLEWIGVARQTCLAHLIRKAKHFSESSRPEIASGGRWILAELRRLAKMAHKPPTQGEYIAWKGRFFRYVRKYLDAGGELGTFTKRLLREAKNLTTFLGYDGVDATNNRCERAIRPYVCRRKTSFGATSLHGEKDISMLLSLHETCRINERSTFSELLTAVEYQIKGKTPSLY